MLASSFLDPVIGLDIHYEMVPTPAPTPTPIPNPFTGVIFDPIGLAVGLAITNAINFVTGAPPAGPVLYWGAFPATNTGTEAKHVPGHILIPPGVAWAPFPKTPKPMIHPGETPKPGLPVKPEDDAVCVFGSKTVTVMGSNAVRLGDILLSCSEPVRLPSSVVMAVPKGAPILIGGPPSLDLMAAAFASLRTRFVSDSLHAALSRMKPSRFRNMLSRAVCFLTGHPVDVATGRVITSCVDLELPGPMPLRIERVYSSGFASRDGPLGHGWSLSLDQSVWKERGKVVLLTDDGRELEFDTFDLPDHQMRVGEQLWNAINRLTLRCKSMGCWEVESHDGVVREFGPVTGRNDGRAMIQRIRSRGGFHEITFQYDQRGRLERVRDSSGRLIYLEHDAQDHVVAVRVPTSSHRGWYVHRRYQYDADGDLVRVTDTQGASWEFNYVLHLLTREKDRTGLSFYFAYDGLGEDARCIRTWGDEGIYDHELSYDKQNHATFVTDSLGHTTRYYTNLAGLVTKIVDPLGGVTLYEYDPRTFQETIEEGPLEERTEKQYDEWGNLIQIIAPGGASTHIEYDRNQPTRATDSRGGEWRWRYDHWGRLVERVLPTGERALLTWEGGLVVRSESASGERISFSYNDHRDVAAISLQERSVQQYEWDNLGRLVKIRTPAGGVLRSSYDAEGRLVATQTVTSVIQRLSYDAEGNIVEEQDGTKRVRHGYGNFHRRLWREEAGARLAYEYDTEARLIGVVNEAGKRYAFARDANGRIVREIGFDEGIRSYQLDSAGRITRVALPSGRSSERAYDIAGRLIEVGHTDGTFARFEYDIDGLLISAENESSRVEYERDAAGRVVTERVDGHEIRSSYDLSSERSEMTTSLGTRVGITRDPLGNPQELFFGPLNGHRRTADVQLGRDVSGAELVRRFASGIEVEWTRDLVGRPTVRRTSLRQGAEAGIDLAIPSSRELDSYAYQWLGADQLSAVVESTTGLRVYAHDGRGRLVRERRGDDIVEREIDAVGNVYRRSDQRDRHYGPSGELEVADGISYEHDPDGSLARKIELDGSSWHFNWNGHGLLSEVVRPDRIRIQFAYDAFARRTSKRVIAEDGTIEREVDFVWDGHTVIHEIDRDLGLTTWHWEPETLTPIAKEHAGHRWAIVTDHLGTPTEMYDESGRLTWRMRIDVFGETTFDTGTAADCEWRWLGQYEDNETSLVYNRWRYYDPQRGSYISADPIGIGGSMNLFVYVDDPTTSGDPFGLVATIDDRGLFAKSNEYGRGSGSGRARIPYQGSRSRDFALANRMAGFDRTPPGYTWHHANYNPRTGWGDMQLVRTAIHQATPHAGGVSDFVRSTGISYDTPNAVRHVESKDRLRGRPCQ